MSISRVPSVHITANLLHTVLSGELTKYDISNAEIRQLVNVILSRGKNDALVHRCVKMSNDKLLKKVAQVKASVRTDANLFSTMLTLKRRQLKHRGIIPLNPGDREWLILKEICGLATEFTNEFGIDKKRGYEKYIEIGMNKMKNYSLNKFKSLHPAICNEFGAIQEIELDDKSEKSEEVERIYLSMVAERIGFSKSYKKDNPEKYIYFIRARIAAEEYRVSYKAYIGSQFSWFEMMNTIPDPAQLVGTKAIERLTKYCFEHNIKMGAQANKKEVDWGKIRQKI